MINLIQGIVIPIISALTGGAMAMGAAVWAIRSTSKDLELSEIRKRKVECLSNLMGLRHTISHNATPEQASLRSFELNRIQVLWGDDPEVLNAVRNFHQSQTNDRLITLIRVMGRSSSLPTESLSDSDITGMFS
jgi:hypothetical protein